MKKVFEFFIVLLFLITGIAFSQTRSYEKAFPEEWSSLDRGQFVFSDLDSFIVQKMNEYHYPGLAAEVIKNDQVVWTGSYGFADIENNIPVTDSTLFMLASVSKTVTGTALMQLWENGLFELDDDINDYLPFDVINPTFPDSVITFRMLLSHTSSINDNWGQMPYFTGDPTIPLGEYLQNYLVPGGTYYSPLNYNGWAPGTQYDYCNIGFALSGYLVEAIKYNFRVYCSDSIFNPLGMTETAWFLSDLDTTHIARPYNYSGGIYYPIPHFGYPDYPDGQLRTSSLQLGRFLSATMQWGKLDNTRILDSSTVSLMLTVQYPSLSTTGLAWGVRNIGNREVWGHTGGDQGVTTAVYFDLSDSVAVIMLANSANNSSAYFIDLIVERLFIFSPVSDIETEVTLPPTFSLEQNYPNPFNPSTKIKYSIPQSSYVTIKVFDVLGKETAILVNEEKPISTYELDWNAANLPSGVYFYQLIAGDFIQTKKMILMK